MATDCLLGLDLGTTTCRAMAFDRRGSVLAEARCEVHPRYDAPGLAVIHADTWWQAACQVLRALSAELAAQRITPLALGFTGLQHAVVPIDCEGRVLADTMLWMDQRCHAEVAWLNGEGSPALEAALGPGARASTTPSLPKLRWMACHEPETVAQARWFLLPKDYVRYRLTGAIGTDPSDAGGAMLYDSRTGDWSPALAALAGIDMAQLPRIMPSDSVAGHVTEPAAAECNLPAGLPVVVGMSDTRATLLGCPASGSDDAVLYLGTAAWLHWAGPRDRSRIMATATTGAALRWLRDLLGGPDGDQSTGSIPSCDSGLSYDTLLEEAARVPAGAEGLLFLPHLSGERGPIPDPLARGTITGLSLRHGRGHLVRALLEGTCCHLRWLMESGGALGAQHVWAVGGAAHSALWMQILSNTLDRLVCTPAVIESGALGAALLAAVGTGLYPDRESAARAMCHPGMTYGPEAATRETHASLYRRWRAAEDRCRAPFL